MHFISDPCSFAPLKVIFEQFFENTPDTLDFLPTGNPLHIEYLVQI